MRRTSGNAAAAAISFALLCAAPSTGVVGMEAAGATGNISVASRSIDGKASSAPAFSVRLAQSAFCRRVFAACATAAAAACSYQCIPPGTTKCKSCVDAYADKCARDSGCL